MNTMVFPYHHIGTLLSVLTLVGVSKSKIIDLSHEHGKKTQMAISSIPGYNRSILEKGYRWGFYLEGGWYSSSEHGGTHLDAPSHLVEGGLTIAEVPLQWFVLEGVMIDCAEEANENQEYGVTISKIEAWEEQNGRIPDEAAVLFNFNWSRKFDDEMSYKGTDDLTETKTFKFPYISKEAGDWLLNNRKPRLIGSDTMTPDPITVDGKDSGLPIHRTYLAENRLILENMRDPWKLPPRNFRLHTAPVAYEDASGTQVRAYAITYELQNNAAHVTIPVGMGTVTWFGLLLVTAILKI